MKEFYEKSVKPVVSHESFVIDFFMGKDKTYIIELNPFHNGAGAGLFSWSTDRHILMHGPLEFRYVTEEPDEQLFSAVLSVQWEQYLIKKHQLMNIPGHEKLKETLAQEQQIESSFIYNFIVRVAKVACCCCLLVNSCCLAKPSKKSSKKQS